MSAAEIHNDAMRRCFVVAPAGAATEAVIGLLTESGIDCLRPDELLRPGAIWSNELTQYLSQTDFVVAVVPPEPVFNIAFELGLACGLDKPAFVVAIGEASLPAQLRRFYTARVPDIARLPDLGPDLRRFLRHAPRIAAAQPAEHPRARARDLSWARARLAELRASDGADRSIVFERLIAEVFQSAGKELTSVDVQAGGGQAGGGADIVVWSDDVSGDIGGAILIECQFWPPRLLAKTILSHLEELVRGSGAALGLLVFDSAPDNTPDMIETPRSLAFTADALLDVLERGAFRQEILSRRRRAASTRGAARALAV